MALSLWRRDRATVVLVAVASLAYGVAWRFVTRPMGDSAGYRTDALVITGGWHHLTDRTPGYPLLLWATGSMHGETRALFVVQLLLHAASVLLAVRVAARVGLPAAWRIGLAALLLTPPAMLSVVFSGSEALAQFLLTLGLWLFARWHDQPSRALALAQGGVLGGLAWVRPSFALLAVPLAVAVWFLRRHRVGAVLDGLAVAVPALALAALLVLVNGVRFGEPTLTPLGGWYLSSRTSGYVQDLPASYEPARSILVAERDRQLLLGEQVDAPNYAFAVRDRLARATGRSGTELDTYMLRLNLHLIAHHPIGYQAAVGQSVTRYAQVDGELAAAGVGRAGSWFLTALHLVLLVAFGLVLVLVPGLALAGAVPGRRLAVLGYGALVSGYGLVVSVAVETGTPRLRSPTDPLLALLLVVGLWTVARARLAR